MLSKRGILGIAFVLFAAIAAGCGAPEMDAYDDADTTPPDSPVAAATVFDVIAASPDHTTLAAAVVAADLDETLRDAGPYTVFAPTDAAFEALPAGTVEGLLEPENKDQLVSILTYHVLAANVPAADAQQMDGSDVETVNGANITITVDAGTVKVNGASVVTADLVADNGVVHVIDAVLLPPANY